MLVDEYLALIDKLRARINELPFNNDNRVRIKILESEILDLWYAVNLMKK